ncbi:unnamed protein product [Staurois parvus]|uniref:Uncharacterized protein n=1 Tax=Staurois parvus TaxID=386267 RepID=A0ABN9FDT7_9NEOB|nr:unnamed protein product [Staurois parvus]
MAQVVAQVGGTGGHRWVALLGGWVALLGGTESTGGWHWWAQVGGHRWAELVGGTAGHRSSEH